ncbi:MAG: hypothetical protein LC624_04615 [Halobacteriales archaeon]|nr:hypothetical protein [Halobacteriales archaeon]
MRVVVALAAVVLAGCAAAPAHTHIERLLAESTAVFSSGYYDLAVRAMVVVVEEQKDAALGFHVVDTCEAPAGRNGQIPLGDLRAGERRDLDQTVSFQGPDLPAPQLRYSLIIQQSFAPITLDTGCGTLAVRRT